MQRFFLMLLVAACSRAPSYPACNVPDDCEVPSGTTARCLEGDNDFRFCAWECDDDDGCDPTDDWRRVCATFQSEVGNFCLPSCRQDPETDVESCPAGFVCRATGGGSPRRVCYPV